MTTVQVPTKTNGHQAIQQWASRDEVREINERLATMTLPGGKKLGPEERLALAQVSVMHNLDPFNGEIWIIPGSGVMIGIKGLRKKGREQIEKRGRDGNFWCNFVEIIQPEQRKRWGIPEGALAFECRLFDTETTNTYVETIKKLTAPVDKGGANLPWEIVSQMVSDKPYTTGIGYATQAEQSKMTLVQRAQKRAEADALKRRFDVPFGLQAGDDAVVDGQWVETVTGEGPDYTDPAFIASQIDQDELERKRAAMSQTPIE